MGETTTFDEVIEIFESSFQDKHIIPRDLEVAWLKKAIASYSVELQPLAYNEDSEEFDDTLDHYIIATLASMMKVYYQEREVSKVNKRISIVGKDLSWDASGNSKKYTKEELDYAAQSSYEMVENQKPPAYG